jgi:hypothetical protein
MLGCVLPPRGTITQLRVFKALVEALIGALDVAVTTNGCSFENRDWLSKFRASVKSRKVKVCHIGRRFKPCPISQSVRGLRIVCRFQLDEKGLSKYEVSRKQVRTRSQDFKHISAPRQLHLQLRVKYITIQSVSISTPSPSELRWGQLRPECLCNDMHTLDRPLCPSNAKVATTHHRKTVSYLSLTPSSQAMYSKSRS